MVAEIKGLDREYLFDLPKIEDSRGNLSFVEERGQIPFRIERVYWIYDVPGGQKRGSHAFKTQEEVIIALSGSFDVVLNDGDESRTYQLNRAYKALYVPAKMWRSLENFATNSVCLVISSGRYEESEYIRSYREYKQVLKLSHAVFEGKKLQKSLVSDQSFENRKSVFDCNLIELPIVKNRAGNLTPVNGSIEVPFEIKRIYFVYDIPYGKTRGMHAHRCSQELILAASGSFDVELDDGTNKKVINLNRPLHAIHIPSGIWAKEQNYSSGAVCLVLSSDIYKESDYVRKYSDFKELYGNKD